MELKSIKIKKKGQVGINFFLKKFLERGHYTEYRGQRREGTEILLTIISGC
jgi:hypothetical protein